MRIISPFSLLIWMSEVNKGEEKNCPEVNARGTVPENIVCLLKDLPSGSLSVLFSHIHKGCVLPMWLSDVSTERLDKVGN